MSISFPWKMFPTKISARGTSAQELHPARGPGGDGPVQHQLASRGAPVAVRLAASGAGVARPADVRVAPPDPTRQVAVAHPDEPLLLVARLLRLQLVLEADHDAGEEGAAVPV